MILLSFLGFGLITDKIKKCADKSGQSERRGFVQVFSNGGVAAVFSVAFLLSRNEAFVVGFCASLAEALADTASSGVGAFSKKNYDIFRFKKCNVGESGGMSVVGTFAGFCGASVISLLCYALDLIGWKEVLIVASVGFVGCVFDSFLGSVFQVKFKCSVCGKTVERRTHCGVPALYLRGVKFVGNSFVNLSSTVFSGVLGLVLFLFEN